MREETRCRHMDYSIRLAARILSHAPSTVRIAHITVFAIPVVEHWLEWEIAQCVCFSWQKTKHNRQLPWPFWDGVLVPSCELLSVNLMSLNVCVPLTWIVPVDKRVRIPLPDTGNSSAEIVKYIHINSVSSAKIGSKMWLRGKSIRSWCDGSLDRSFIVDPLSYFKF